MNKQQALTWAREQWGEQAAVWSEPGLEADKRVGVFGPSSFGMAREALGAGKTWIEAVDATRNRKPLVVKLRSKDGAA